MFHDIPPVILERMTYLEELDKLQRSGKTNLDKFCPIPPETGRFIATIASSSPEGQWLELGTGAGYSTLWLSLARKKITTFECAEQNIRLAKETFACSQLGDQIDLVTGNLLSYLPAYKDVSFCFLDTTKDIYTDCYDIVIPNMLAGGMLLADNVISHKNDLDSFLQHALMDKRVDACVVPIGKGVLMCRVRLDPVRAGERVMKWPRLLV